MAAYTCNTNSASEAFAMFLDGLRATGTVLPAKNSAIVGMLSMALGEHTVDTTIDCPNCGGLGYIGGIDNECEHCDASGEAEDDSLEVAQQALIEDLEVIEEALRAGEDD